jgi:hypothetical protein
MNRYIEKMRNTAVRLAAKTGIYRLNPNQVNKLQGMPAKRQDTDKAKLFQIAGF